MKKYYLHNGTEHLGPYDLDELKARKINNNTPVWHEGLPGWTTANEIDELKDIVRSSTPPPFGTTQSALPIDKQVAQRVSAVTVAPPKKNNSAGIAILITVVVIGLIIGGLAILKNTFSGSTDDNSYQAQVMSIEEIERSQPTKFLSASGTYKENFWGNKFKVNCVISNKATVATYKDAVVRITYYSKTETALGSKEYTVYETFPPNSTKTVELKIENYKDVSSLGWDVVSAVSY